MDGWNTRFLLGRPIFRGYVSFRECKDPFFNQPVFHGKEGFFRGFLLALTWDDEFSLSCGRVFDLELNGRNRHPVKIHIFWLLILKMNP